MKKIILPVALLLVLVLILTPTCFAGHYSIKIRNVFKRYRTRHVTITVPIVERKVTRERHVIRSPRILNSRPYFAIPTCRNGQCFR